MFFAVLLPLLPLVIAGRGDLHKITPGTTTSAAVFLPVAENAHPLVGAVPRSASKKDALRNASGMKGQAIVSGGDGDQEYLTNITVGGQPFTVVIDTGSSDTWLAGAGFNCFNLTGYPEPQETCAFGTLYNANKSSTFKPYPGHVFNIEYGDKEYLHGTVGFETIEVGGITVTSQEFGNVYDAAWNGDGVNSGLLGLAYPALTSVYNGTDPTQTFPNNTALYNPFFFTAVAQKKVKHPYFSLALNRGSATRLNSTYDPNLGYLSFGGRVPVPVTNTHVTIPVQGIYSNTSKTPKYAFYTVDIESYSFPGSTSVHTASNNTILDSGTTLNILPPAIVKAYNAKFTPPASYDSDQELYYVDCNAKVPPFAVKIGGKTFTIDGRDQVVPNGIDGNGKNVCISGTQPGTENDDFYILGDVFLHNVISTFNIQAEEITLSQRSKY